MQNKAVSGPCSKKQQKKKSQQTIFMNFNKFPHLIDFIFMKSLLHPQSFKLINILLIYLTVRNGKSVFLWPRLCAARVTSVLQLYEQLVPKQLKLFSNKITDEIEFRSVHWIAESSWAPCDNGDTPSVSRFPHNKAYNFCCVFRLAYFLFTVWLLPLRNPMILIK